MNDVITIRRSNHTDRPSIQRLAGLDSGQAPAGETLLAFAGTELRAALPLNGQAPLADPFHHTAQIVDLLRIRADQEQIKREPGRLAALRLRAA